MARPFRYPIRRSPRSDTQQYLVYRMENEAIGGRKYMRISRATARQIVRGVCRNYGVSGIKIRWRDLGRWAAMWYDENDRGGTKIVLNTKKGTSKDLLTLTHELAHHIHHELSEGADTTHEDHGPEFMACHMSILDTLRVIPVAGMKAICDTYKVRYFDPGSTNSLLKLKRICKKKRG